MLIEDGQIDQARALLDLETPTGTREGIIARLARQCDPVAQVQIIEQCVC